ncbi:hypothetical protein CFP56_015717 [Quercus suber]|uniref:Uncharacterized protein n=1 Tax=Quercus suber TaxID=58331 RepID=A0AAW0KQA9_QUESU
MKEWEEWDGIGGTMREEEAQESGLKSLPDFLPTTPLKHLDIGLSRILRECCKTEIGDQWPKISHIPNISIHYRSVRRDGLMSLSPKACEFLIRPMKNEMKSKSRRKALRDIFNNGGRIYPWFSRFQKVFFNPVESEDQLAN